MKHKKETEQITMEIHHFTKVSVGKRKNGDTKQPEGKQ